MKKVTHEIFPMGALQIFGALEGESPEQVAQDLMDEEERILNETQDSRESYSRPLRREDQRA